MTHVSVTVDDAHLSTIHAVARSLRAAGMDVVDVLDGLGIITGTIDRREQREVLQLVDGVVSVDEDMPMRLPPPDSPLQ